MKIPLHFNMDPQLQIYFLQGVQLVKTGMFLKHLYGASNL